MMKDTEIIFKFSKKVQNNLSRNWMKNFKIQEIKIKGV